MSLLRKLLGRETRGSSVDDAVSLEATAYALMEQGRQEEAVAAAERALAIRRSLLADDDPAMTDGLRAVGTMLLLADRSEEALPFFMESVRVLEAQEGAPHPSLVGDTWLLAGTLQSAGRMDAAWPVFGRWIDLVRTLHHGQHELYPSVIRQLWQYWFDASDFAAAESILADNLPALQSLLAEESTEYCEFLRLHAAALEAGGRYVAAEVAAERHTDLTRRIDGERSVAFIGSLGQLASVRRALRHYESAMTLALRMSALCDETPEADLVLRASALWELAENELQLGRHDRAESSYRRAIEILREQPPGPQLPRALDGLAELYQRTGHLGKASEQLTEAHRLYAELAGERSFECAQVLSSQANLQRSTGDPAGAERIMNDALAIMRETVGEAHPAYGRALHDLGTIFDVAGDAERARNAFERALAVKRDALGDDHPVVASDLDSLGDLNRRAGRFAEAETQLTRAVAIMRRSLHDANPKLHRALRRLAAVFAATGRFHEATTSILEALSGENEMTGQLFALSSEEQRIQLLAAYSSMDVLLTLVSRHFADDPLTVRAAFEQVLRRKGMGAEALGAQRDAVLSGKYPHLAGALESLHALRSRIAQTALAGPGPEGPAVHARWLVECTAQREAHEIELARAIPELKVTARLRAVDTDSVATALPSGSALIEYVQFAADDLHDDGPHPPRLLAFVLVAGSSGSVRLVDLGEVEPTRRHLADFRASITGDTVLRDLVPVDDEASVDTNSGTSLRAAIFDPLRPALGGRTRLFISPDGFLNRLPLEILPLDDDRRVIDDYAISYLSAGRDALRLGATPAGEPGNSVVVADPDFDFAAAPADRAAAAASGDRAPLRGAGLRFSRLPGTRVEGERIASLLNATSLFDADALEQRIKELHSPRVLHIATHGFFLPDRARPASGPGDAVSLGAGAGETQGRLARRLDNPMVRSGLALAGANTWLAEGTLPAAAEDALLNGEDVSGLDLTATEMVVLSACETGLGDVQVGEGVFGLRRAFILAGAATLVMSLWKVPDLQTQELMTEFYRLVLGGSPRAEALRGAQLALKARHPDPLYWGAFICQGEPGPLGVRSPPGDAASRTG